MLLILISWIYIIFTSIVAGVSINRVFQIVSCHPIISIFNGLFGIMLFTSFWAIVFPVNVYFHLALLIINLILYFFNLNFIKSNIRLFAKQLKELSFFLKSLLAIVSLLILAQCASAPFLVDNETYYIQTIKWLNEYGFAKGLINLHLFLGQTSGWHILQSAFSFSFLTDSLNDLSGLALLLGNVYAFIQIDKYFKNNSLNKLYLLIGLLPITNLLLFQFISSPSPDLAIYVLSVIVFYQFVLSYNEYNKDEFLSLLLLTAFMVSIKLTALPFLIFPVAIYLKHFNQTRLLNYSLATITIIITSLLVIKNVIITGNPLYPFLGIDSIKTSWHLPNTVSEYFKNYGLAYGYQMTPEVFAESSYLLRFKNWFFANGLHSIFNKAIVVLILILPFIIKKWYQQKAYWMFYFSLVITMIILWNSSPQYRFFLPFILISGFIILSVFNLNKSIIKSLFAVSTILVFITIFIPINRQAWTENKQHQEASIFKIDYVLIPHANSKYLVNYKTITIENTDFNAPNNETFFWETGNTSLPAVSEAQLEYFKTHFSIIPQMRTKYIRDGFYSKNVSEE